jgi:hypothetical protein
MTDKMKALLRAIVKQHIDPKWDDDSIDDNSMVWIPRELLEEAEALTETHKE